MPAMLDDPTSPAIYRVSGDAPYPVPYGPVPDDITIKQVTLRDRVTTATLLPFSSPAHVPPKLSAYLCELLNREIEKGDTYPMLESMALSSFAPYWFANFGAVMVVGAIESVEEVAAMEARGADWSRECLGSFYVKPNYPGRSSHVCNGGFLVTDAARNRGVGRLMGECYLDWAPKLGYTYSVFNLVYESNVASLRIWDALGFKRIGRVKGCGNLKSYPGQLIDAIIFGRELGGEGDEYITEERFDKIRFYLKNGSYPLGSDRAEKSRLRSAATHYRLVSANTGNEDDDKLMLKGKEVISDPHKQYEIARQMHAQTHGGINKTTASIAEKYHWVRIKETVSAAIRNCTECKDPAAGGSKSTPAKKDKKNGDARAGASNAPVNDHSASQAGGDMQPRQQHQHQLEHQQQQVVAGADMPSPPPPTSQQQHQHPQQSMAPIAHMTAAELEQYAEMPVDPQIMQQWQDQANAMAVDTDPDFGDLGQGDIEGAGAGGDSAEDRLRAQLEAITQGAMGGGQQHHHAQPQPQHVVPFPGSQADPDKGRR